MSRKGCWCKTVGYERCQRTHRCGVRATPRRLAYVAVIHEGRYRLGVAEEGLPGYFPCKDDSDAGGAFPTYAAASRVADAMNESLGYTREEAFLTVASSMGERHGQGRTP